MQIEPSRRLHLLQLLILPLWVVLQSQRNRSGKQTSHTHYAPLRSCTSAFRNPETFTPCRSAPRRHRKKVYNGQRRCALGSTAGAASLLSRTRRGCRASMFPTSAVIVQAMWQARSGTWATWKQTTSDRIKASE